MFCLGLTTHSGVKNLRSLQPIKEIQPYLDDDKLHVVKYERSPIMSTYLVAYCIGDFEYVETTSEDGEVLCRVYTPPGKKEQGKFALSVSAKILPYYKDYFGVPYPLPKLDLVAIADFSSGTTWKSGDFLKNIILLLNV